MASCGVGVAWDGCGVCVVLAWWSARCVGGVVCECECVWRFTCLKLQCLSVRGSRCLIGGAPGRVGGRGV